MADASQRSDGSQLGGGGSAKPQLFLPSDEEHDKEVPNGKIDGTQSTSDGTQTPQQVQQGAAAKLHADTIPPKPTTEVTNNGQGQPKTGGQTDKSAPPAGGASGPPGGTEANPLSAKPISSDVKSSSSDSKPLAASQPSGTAAERTVKPQDQVKTEAPPHLIASNPYAPKTEQTGQQSAKSEVNKSPDQPRNTDIRTETSAKALDEKSHNTSDSQPVRGSNESLGGIAREQVKPHGPPADQARAQDVSHRHQDPTENPKITNQETKSESKSASIPPPVIIPTDTHQAQKTQNPASMAHQPETAPVAPPKDLAAKPVEPKFQLGEAPGQHANNGKGASEAAQDKNLEPPRSGAGAGELDSKNSAGNEPIAHEQPHVKEAGSTSKSDVASGEQSHVEAKTVKNELPSPKDLTPGQQITDRNDATFMPSDKSKGGTSASVETGVRNEQPPGSKDTIPQDKVTGGKDERKQDKPNESTADSGDRHLPPINAVSDKNIASTQGIPGDSKQDKQAESSEKNTGSFIFTDGKTRIDLADPRVVNKFIDVLKQILATGNVTVTDNDSRTLATCAFRMNPDNTTKLLEVLLAGKLDRALPLLSDKLPDDLADDRVRSRVELPQKIMQLERQLGKITSQGDSFANDLTRAVGQFAVGEIGQNAGIDEIVDKAAGSVPNPSLSAILQIVAGLKQLFTQGEAFLRNTFSGDAMIGTRDDASSEETEEIISLPEPTYDEDGNMREKYTVKTGDSYESIAKAKCNDARLGVLIEGINKSYATVYSDGDYERHKLRVGDVIDIPTKPEQADYKRKLGATTMNSISQGDK